MMKQYILIMLFTLAGLAGMAQTNEPLPGDAEPLTNQLYLSPSDSTVWAADPFSGLAINLGSWWKVDSLASLRVSYVPDIDSLEAYAGDENVVVVIDTLRGGLFTYQSNGENDGGTVFTATGRGGGYWHRQFNLSDGLNVLWYGADPNGVNDCAEILEDMIWQQSEKGRIRIPAGNYRIERGIGDIPVAGQGTKLITHDVEIVGEPGARIFAASPGQIGHIIGFDVRESKIKISGLELDGAGLANRGIYFRQAFSSATIGYSYFEGNDISISGIASGTGGIFNLACAITVYGKFDVTISNSEISGVTASGTVYTSEGIRVSGSNPLSMVPRHVSLNNINVSNIRVLDDSPTATAYGIRVEGDLSSAVINECVIDSVVTEESTTIAGILHAQTTNSPKSLVISNNLISNIFRQDSVVNTDQDGIYLSKSPDPAVTDDFQAIITGNIIRNSRGRAMKIQNMNTKVYGNTIVLESGFDMPSPSDTRNPCIDFQYLSGVAENNTFIFKNTNHYSHLFRVYKRTEADNLKSINVVGNKVYAPGDIISLVSVTDAGNGINGHVLVQGNNVDATIAQLVLFQGIADETHLRTIYIKDNSIRGLTNHLISNNQLQRLSVFAENNKNLSSDVSLSNEYESAVMVNNIGITGSSSGSAAFTGPVSAAPATTGSELATLNQVNSAPFVNFTDNQESIAGNKSWTGRHIFNAGSPGLVQQGGIDISKGANGAFIRGGMLGSATQSFIIRAYATSGVQLDLSEGGVMATGYWLSALNTAPASSTATGTTGEIRVTATHIYVCTATNTWVRTALTTW